MDRREFVRLTGGGMAASAIAETVVSAQQAQSPALAKGAQKAGQKVLFKVGTGGGTSVDSLKLLSTYGVNNVTGGTASRRMDEAWSVDSLSRRRDLAASYGVSLDMLSLPMSSSEISIAEMPDIYLAGPNRDRQIDEICQMIRNSARAGIFT